MKMNTIFFIFLTTIFADSQGKYVELLPDEEKQDFLERVARRILETVQIKENPKKYSREITDEQLKEQNDFIQSILKQESEQMRRSKDVKNTTEERISEGNVKVEPLESDRIKYNEDTNTGLQTDPLNLTVRDIKDITDIGLINSNVRDTKRRFHDEPLENATEYIKGLNIITEHDPPMQKRSVSDGNDDNVKIGAVKEMKEAESKLSGKSISVSGAHLNQESEALESTPQLDMMVEQLNHTQSKDKSNEDEESASTSHNNNTTANKEDLPITATENTTIPVYIELITTKKDGTTENSVNKNGNGERIKTTLDNLVTTDATTISEESNITDIKSSDEQKKSSESFDAGKISQKAKHNIQPKAKTSVDIIKNIPLSSKSDVDESYIESTANSIDEHISLSITPKVNLPNNNFMTEEANVEPKALEIVEKSENVTLSSELNNVESTTESSTKQELTGLGNAPSDGTVDDNIKQPNILKVDGSITERSNELIGLGNAPSTNSQGVDIDDVDDRETESDLGIATTINDSEETVTLATVATQSTKTILEPIKPQKINEVKPNNKTVLKVNYPQAQRIPHRVRATELKKTTKKKKKVCGLLSCSDYKVFEVPLEKPFLQGKSIILKDPDLAAQGSELMVPQNSESDQQDLNSTAGQPYFIPVYNYSPNNAYFNPRNKLGPNVVEENTIENDNKILRGGRENTNLEFELDLGEMRRYVGYKNVDDDFSDEVNKRSQRPGRKGGNTEPHIMSSDLPNSDEEMHPYNSMKHGMKSHIQAVRQILQEKQLYHAPDQPKDYMKAFFGKTSTSANIPTTEDITTYYYETTTPKVDIFVRPILREHKIEKIQEEKPTSHEVTTERFIRRKLKIKHRVYDSEEDISESKTINDKYLINRVKRKINSLIPININKKTLNQENFKIPKNRIDAIAKILNIRNKNLIVSLQKLQNMKFKKNHDNKVGVHINVLKDLIGQDRKALKQYDWLATTVQIQSAVAKLLELINRIKQSKPIHPADQQIIKYVNFLHKHASEVIKATKIRDLLRKKLALPKNRKKKKNKILKEKGLINRVWLYLRSLLPDTTVEGLSNLEQFLKDVEDGLYNLHDALRSIGLVTKYDHQNWYENLRDLYLTTKPRHLREVLLHVTMARLVGIIEYACQNGLEDDYVAFMKSNKDLAKKTLEEMVFVIRIVDDINNNELANS